MSPPHMKPGLVSSPMGHGAMIAKQGNGHPEWVQDNRGFDRPSQDNGINGRGGYGPSENSSPLQRPSNLRGNNGGSVIGVTAPPPTNTGMGKLTTIFFQI